MRLSRAAKHEEKLCWKVSTQRRAKVEMIEMDTFLAESSCSQRHARRHPAERCVCLHLALRSPGLAAGTFAFRWPAPGRASASPVSIVPVGILDRAVGRDPPNLHGVGGSRNRGDTAGSAARKRERKLIPISPLIPVSVLHDVVQPNPP